MKSDYKKYIINQKYIKQGHHSEVLSAINSFLVLEKILFLFILWVPK